MTEEEIITAFVIDVVEEARLQVEVQRRRSVARDPWELSDNSFKKKFRLTKDLTAEVMTLVEPFLPRNSIDLKTKVLCALNFFAQGSYQTPVGDMVNLDVSQSTVSRCIAEVVSALNHSDVFGQWVHFPETFNELNRIVRDFYSAYGIPGTIGCIDCTHVAIVPPSRSSHDERSYVNRKNYHSINTQLICDAQLQILNVNALFPGSTHYSHIWNTSNALSALENIHASGHKNYHLLADSGYALRPWCLIPISEPAEGTAEFRFNSSFKRARCTIERCNGVLKGRFRCLLKDRTLHYTPNKATKIINACTVLHNMCIARNIEHPIWDDLTDEQLGILPNVAPPAVSSARVNEQLSQARIKRVQIINNYFTDSQ